MIQPAANQIPALKRRPAKALILWPLVLYFIVQILPNFDKINHNGRSHFHTQDANFIRHTVPRDGDESLCSFQDAQNLNLALTSSSDSCSSSKKISQYKHNDKKSSKLLNDIYPSLTSTSLLKILNHLHQSFLRYEGSIFGGKVLLAEASMYQAEKEIQNLNSTSFINELIQHKVPFPHIELIEYYVPHSRFCANFKATYSRLAKEIHPWRNVIRPSAIDLGDSKNSLIAESWHVEIVPTLRLHPPPAPSSADKLHTLLNNLKDRSLKDIQRSMCQEYNQTNLMVDTLNVTSYMDKVELFKSDLRNYVERYVKDPNNYIPSSWPNLKPVTEAKLDELRNNHPRQELFLLIEIPGKVSSTDIDQSSFNPSSALNIILELSSSAAWKAIRYVRANDNKALIEDVITNYRKQMGDSKQDNPIMDQLNLLDNLVSNQTFASGQANNILLIHIDGHISSGKKGAISSAFPYMTLVTSNQLENLEQSVLVDKQQGGSLDNRARRDINHSLRYSRSLFTSEGLASHQNGMSLNRRLELLALYIEQTYTATKEDREFANAIKAFDQDDITYEQFVNLSRNFDSKQDSPTTTMSSRLQLLNNTTTEPKDQTTESQDSGLIDKINSIVTSSPKLEQTKVVKSEEFPGDYGDKLKAIRYMLFIEVPKINLSDKSLAEQQYLVSTLVDLVSVIKVYFPLPDSSSVHFIDSVHRYLIGIQKRISQSTGKGLIFDPRAFRQEMKRLEEEEERLPEIREWKVCEHSGYPCALWRLFHTLAAFEYKKLNQLRQNSQGGSRSKIVRQPHHHALQESLLPAPSVEAMTMKPGDLNVDQSPVEHLVSPPSADAPLSLTIASTSPNQISNNSTNNPDGSKKPERESDLPTPVILVMRDYISNFFSCVQCRENFRSESGELSRDRIRQEPAEFSVMWLWETHNRVNKRLSVDLETNPEDHRKVWFPTYEQCPSCYKKPPSFFREKSVDPDTMFKESIEWDRQEVLAFLISEYTKQPMDCYANIFGYQVPMTLGYVILISICCLVMIIISRCLSSYIERQKRHKATLLNGSGAHYSLQLP